MITRGRALDMVITIALGALIAVLAPLWLLHQGANRVATARRRGRRVEIPRVGASATRDCTSSRSFLSSPHASTSQAARCSLGIFKAARNIR
jgi:hypothetical protein